MGLLTSLITSSMSARQAHKLQEANAKDADKLSNRAEYGKNVRQQIQHAHERNMNDSITASRHYSNGVGFSGGKYTDKNGRQRDKKGRYTK